MDLSSIKNMEIDSARNIDIERAEEVLRGIIIPPRPSVLVQVLEEQAVSDPDLHKIGNIISSDVALSASTLKVVNSPILGLRKKVGSVHHAVSLLGVSNIVHVVTGLMLHTAFRGEKGPFMDEFWERSNRVAAISALVARKHTTIPAEEAYTAGLFLDCGVPLLNQRCSGYREVFQEGLVTQDETLPDIEDRRYGTDHTLAGLLVGRSWKLPDTFCQVILRHHDTQDYYSDKADHTPEYATLLAITFIAQHLYRVSRDLPISYEWQKVGSIVLPFLGISKNELDQLRGEVNLTATGPI